MNIGENKGRRLNRALQRFASMLIDEAHDLTGFPYSKLAEELGISEDQIRRYRRLPGKGNARAPQAAAIQQLENRVAKLLKRTAHIVVVENNSKLGEERLYFSDHVAGKPGDDLNLRSFESSNFQLGYEGDWPTYRRLKSHRPWLSENLSINDLINLGAHPDQWPEMLRLYAWQWGVLWDRELPWLSRDALGEPIDAPVEKFLPALTEKAKLERKALAIVGSFPTVRNLIPLWEVALLSGLEDLSDELCEHVRTVGGTLESLVDVHGADLVAAAFANEIEGIDGPRDPFEEPPDEFFNGPSH